MTSMWRIFTPHDKASENTLWIGKKICVYTDAALGTGEKWINVYAHFVSFLFEIRKLLSLLRDWPSKILCLSMVFRYDDRKWVKVKYFSSNWLLFGFFPVCSNTVSTLFTFILDSLDEELCCGSSKPWGSSKMPSTYMLGPQWCHTPYPKSKAPRSACQQPGAWRGCICRLSFHVGLGVEHEGTEAPLTLFYKTRAWLSGKAGWPVSPMDPPFSTSPVLGLQAKSHGQRFYMASGDANSGSQSCAESTILI